MITQQNIFNHEFVGLSAEIIESTNRAFVGLSGKVIDETQSMIFLETKNGTKMIQKEYSKWRFASNDDIFTVSGDKISKRPEDRIKVKA